ncbi:LCP family protein [Actinacidiphila yeochonensis]|uniref:LCP family protein n=1 Tax=Actinacidiphila yeochonensis TaxID=89050 RepID=UPI000A9B9A23|nr:LCP family protein [Actinacidiphila yeochonensis]
MTRPAGHPRGDSADGSSKSDGTPEEVPSGPASPEPDEDGARPVPEGGQPASGEPGSAPGDGAGTGDGTDAEESTGSADDSAASNASDSDGPVGAGQGPAVLPEPFAAEVPAPRRRHRWLRYVASGTAVVVLVGAGGLWYVYRHLNANITTDNVTENELKAQAPQRPPKETTAAENILLIGSDSRAGGDSKYGHDSGTQRSDTTILLHISADRGNATAISIPRDLMVQQPECVKSDGSTVKARFEQFNWAFQFGGAACTIRTVEELTGVRIDHHLTVDFGGFKNMVNAVDGVEVCVPEAVHDTDAHLDLPAGRQKLDGEQALGYVRARHGLGDGSDTGRIGRQQDFLASLVKKVQTNGVLLNPEKVYPLLNAATKSLTADPGLNSLSDLYSLARTLQKIPTGSVHFVTTPVEPYVQDHNRDQLVQPDAQLLFAAVQADRAVNVSDSGHTNGVDSGVVDSPSPAGASTGTPGGTPSGTPPPPHGQPHQQPERRPHRNRRRRPVDEPDRHRGRHPHVHRDHRRPRHLRQRPMN